MKQMNKKGQTLTEGFLSKMGVALFVLSIAVVVFNLWVGGLGTGYDVTYTGNDSLAQFNTFEDVNDTVTDMREKLTIEEDEGFFNVAFDFVDAVFTGSYKAARLFFDLAASYFDIISGFIEILGIPPVVADIILGIIVFLVLVAILTVVLKVVI